MFLYLIIAVSFWYYPVSFCMTKLDPPTDFRDRTRLRWWDVARKPALVAAGRGLGARSESSEPGASGRICSVGRLVDTTIHV